MSDPTSELRRRIKDTDTQLAGFERQAVTILAIIMTFAVMTSSAAMQLLP